LLPNILFSSPTNTSHNVFKVGAATYEEHLKEQLHKAGGNAEHLDVSGVVQLATKVLLSMTGFEDESKKWCVPLTWSEKLQQFNQILREWADAHRRLENVRDQIHRVVCDAKSENSDKKKSYHEQKHKVVEWFERSTTGLGSPLCTVFGTLCYYRAEKPETKGISKVWSIKELTVAEGMFGNQIFSEPKLVSAEIADDVDHPQRSYWHEALQDFFGAHKKVLDERWKGSVEKVVKQRTQGSLVGTLVTSVDFPFNTTEGPLKEYFHPVKTPIVVASKRACFADLRSLSNGLRGHPLWMVSGNRDVAVFMVSPQQLVEHADLKAFLQKCDIKELQCNPAVIMKPRDALYVPIGWVPIWLVLPASVNLFNKRPQLAPRGRQAQKGAKEKESPVFEEAGGAFFVPIYEIGKIDGVDAAVRAKIATDLVSSSAVPPPKLNEIAEVVEWKTTIPTVSASDGVVVD